MEGDEIKKVTIMKNYGNYNLSGSGISFTGLLTIVFIILKLCNVIDWAWLWVLAPLWIPIAIVLAIFLVVVLVLYLQY